MGGSEARCTTATAGTDTLCPGTCIRVIRVAFPPPFSCRRRQLATLVKPPVVRSSQNYQTKLLDLVTGCYNRQSSGGIVASISRRRVMLRLLEECCLAIAHLRPYLLLEQTKKSHRSRMMSKPCSCQDPCSQILEIRAPRILVGGRLSSCHPFSRSHYVLRQGGHLRYTCILCGEL